MTTVPSTTVASSMLQERTRAGRVVDNNQQFAAHGEILLRRAGSADIPEIARIHQQSLPQEFLVKLGPHFLTKAFYPTLFDAANVRTTVALCDGQVVGFLITRIGLSGVATEILLRHPVSAIRHSMSALFRRPTLIWEMVGIVSQLMHRRTPPRHKTAELFLMAVDGRHRRRGVGRCLIEDSARILAQSGVVDYVVLLHADNLVADRAYLACGFNERAEHEFSGVRWCERRMRLTQPVEDHTQPTSRGAS